MDTITVKFQSVGSGVVEVKADAVWASSSDEQSILVTYPQEAVPQGWAKIVDDGVESNRLDDVAYPCWSLVAGGSSFNIATSDKKPCDKN